MKFSFMLLLQIFVAFLNYLPIIFFEAIDTVMITVYENIYPGVYRVIYLRSVRTVFFLTRYLKTISWESLFGVSPIIVQGC